MSRHILAALAGAIVMALAAVPSAVAKSAPQHGCDPIDPRACLLPYPDDYFTVADRRADTGRRLNLNPTELPANTKGQTVDTTDYDRSDGFSPGTGILTYVPGIDLKKTGAVPINDLRESLDPGQPIAVIDAQTGRRQLVWAELDSGATTAKDRILMIHPARNFDEGHHYIVALSNLRRANGSIIQPNPAFRALRDGLRVKSPALAARRKHFAWIFATLRKKAKIKRSSLYLAWDFTVASQRNIEERMLSIRDGAFHVLGDDNLVDGKVSGRPPAFHIDSVQDFAPCDPGGCKDGQSDQLARKVTGTMIAPCYLDKRGCPPGSRFAYRKLKRTAFAWIPRRIPGNTMNAQFECIIPRAAMTAPARAALYGHGLFGSPDEVMASNVQAMAQEHDFVFCATREIGMADEDVPNAISILKDFSGFPSLADRLQQGMLNGLLLGRLMIHPQGLIHQAAFQTPSGKPTIDTSALFYDGNSQGAIFGGALTAVAPDFQRAVLGVPGMDYSLLLPRSVDFDTYDQFFQPSYPDRFNRILLLTVAQTLWDRGEADGWAEHMTGSPPPNSPLHSVLLQGAVGDHQVAQISAENEARTINDGHTQGAVGRLPAYDPGRTFDKIPLYGITPAGSLTLGSAIVMWDSGPIRDGGALGTDVAPLGDVPPRAGNDPHELVRATPAARQQKSDFLQVSGRLTDPCPPDRGCHTQDWPY
ncbi:MAG TPA: hypothetical protein VMT10_10435 [Solirubrobacteraceae bacterium]|nr:hypothetical protein [Solirubrobacteraceae bacterium]